MQQVATETRVAYERRLERAQVPAAQRPHYHRRGVRGQESLGSRPEPGPSYLKATSVKCRGEMPGLTFGAGTAFLGRHEDS